MVSLIEIFMLGAPPDRILNLACKSNLMELPAQLTNTVVFA